MTQQLEHSAVLAGGGEMGALMRSIDWSQTAVGPVEGWPQSLRTALSILLETGFPMYIAWGRDFTQFYNDGYRPILGSTKHPSAMGRGTRETFAEIWHIIGPMFEGVMQGHPTSLVDFLLPLDRYGFAEECYFIFSYSPIREESGQVGGVLVTVTETTQRVLGERRLETTQALAAETRAARTVKEACEIAARVLAANTADLPFARLYLTSPDRRSAVLACDGEPRPDDNATPHSVSLEAGAFAFMLESPETPMREITATSAEPVRFGREVPAAGRTLALPITHQGADHPVGVLVVGTSPRLILDEAYRDFIALAASQIGTAIASAQALEDAKARAEALAELDRAKTTFFSNVSHEFRTPLTLMLAPTEEALDSPDGVLQGAALESVHRNQLRLLKLVNTLLDFSRMEAGRVTARFEETDLATLTANLVSAFRSATQRAGLELVVNCPPLPAPVYVDVEMWEKIVLNLLSNAFKFTLKGSIQVELECAGGHAELRVRDTGVGIAPEDLDRVFERFYRIERSAGRTHEGSGIGLALVRELVAIHGGDIRAQSTIGQGTVFTVRIPLGAAHLPAKLVAAGAPERSARALGADSYVNEALRWLPEEQRAARPAANAAGAATILVADDNADMRDYLVRLLSPRFIVEAVRDGEAALEAARSRRPDVIVSDVMMPGMDGFELLAALRADESTRAIPMILLSARAGEEARIDGLHAGADDYLVKPFSARELVARIETQLMRAKMRSLEERHAVRMTSVFSNAPVGIAILQGPQHVFEFANRAYRDLISARDPVGKSVREALPELAGQGIFELLDHVYATGKPYVGRSVPVKLLGREGNQEEIFFDFVYQPLVEGAGAVGGIAVVCYDVSELTIAKREAEAASRAKDEFLAMLGHELRNPLAPIVTALQLMRLRNVSGAEHERTIIERQVRHVVSLVDDLLDVSRITRGHVQLKCETVEIADVVAKAVEMTAPAIEQRRHQLSVDVPRGLIVNGDAGRLAQVLANLLMNAAKYTDAGGRIAVSAVARDRQIEIAVADSGRGISAEMLPRVFDLFSQERQEIDRREGGLGLGLAIVKNLVQAHGGSVSARSEGKARGATLVVSLPRALHAVDTEQPEDTTVVKPTRVLPSGLRVLVVDDNSDAAELLALSLEALGHSTRVEYNGAAALETVRHFRPDVALLDLGLPVMDGFEVARRIRAMPDAAEIALVAVTGYGRELDRQRTREAGFDHHMVKPVDLATVNEWLLVALERARTRRASA
jgi:signal transduction histidine kinase/DNA-binding response OmpR family regulator